MNTGTDTGPSPAPGEPDPQGPQQPPARSGATRAILITTAVVGGIALAGAGISAATQAFRGQVTQETSTQTVGVDGLSAVTVDMAAADFTLEYGDVEEAQLEATGTRGEWNMRRSGSELVVTSPRVGWFSWNWGCVGWCDDGETVTLTLPHALERGAGIDASIDISSGAVRANGAFRDLSLDLSAGSVVATGAARSVDVDMSAGRLEADLTDVGDAAFEISAGAVDATLRGTAPESVLIDVSAGSFDFTLPDAQYRVESDVSAGSVDNLLDTSPDSPHHIKVAVAAGSVTLASAR